MKLYIFGSCSGTEPMQGRHHTSLAFEINGRFYWFDAGESCSYTAHLMGVDLLSVSEIFVSHPHMDHVGGLGNLLWNIRKLVWRKDTQPKYGNISVYIPSKETFDGILSILQNAEGNYKNEYETIYKNVSDGLLFENSDIKVSAFHNLHLPKAEDGWKSFSYLIFAEGKKIIYSGDLEGLDDISELLSGGCDLLLMETGHHSADTICRQIADAGYNIKEIYFLHHGRAILGDFDGELQKCRKIISSVKFCSDKDIFDL